MVATLLRVYQILTIPDNLQLLRVSMEAFENMLQVEAGKVYDNYDTISHSLLGAAAKGSPGEVEAQHRASLERHMDQVADLVMQMAEMVGMIGNN